MKTIKDLTKEQLSQIVHLALEQDNNIEFISDIEEVMTMLTVNGLSNGDNFLLFIDQNLDILLSFDNKPCAYGNQHKIHNLFIEWGIQQIKM